MFWLLMATILLHLFIVRGDNACNKESCHLPDCLCMSTSPPLHLKPSDIPQLVFLTFDDSVDRMKNKLFRRIREGRQNPNGCPIALTYFINHSETDYTTVADLYNQGHEIASHTVTHKDNLTYWKEGSVDLWTKEIDELRDMVSAYAKIPKSEVKGFRAPYLQIGGENTYRALKSLNMLYDSSMVTFKFNDPPLWPYTLDFGNAADCPGGSCPKESYPGLWSVPLIRFQDHQGNFCSQPDFVCAKPTTAAETFQSFQSNFQLHNKTRAPFGIFVHTYWFEKGNHIFDGYLQFIDYLLGLDYVYIVTITKGLQWMRNPLTLTQLQFHDVFGCDAGEGVTCYPRNCSYPFGAVARRGQSLMESCTGCPDVYPWLDNPFGDLQP